MSYRYVRILVFFDLPVETSSEKRDYRQFRKYLITSGFFMMQESVYCKLAPNNTVAASISQKIKNNKPKKGLVEILIITEKQYSKIEYIVGDWDSEVLNNNKRLIIL
ncbi:CRISPR-associated endonuclease Cas2 [Eggerthia catenaformis]|uniref:CRISPR-associated endonuclease Cas2 n=1 Tax=Eggerthia catenaformis TaxID=31973 RepID=UPI003C702111